eukprot:TRINITY_DN1015_c0_g1_i2.p1 TRINITY_DN1015_c0_g1~~TRINITY_DN1015_c0_g1_i2.p1  ORF type:complete len:515 (+),score=145.62 TRINITY_DN1015_c0_g1_i2:193-1737(+)
MNESGKDDIIIPPLGEPSAAKEAKSEQAKEDIKVEELRPESKLEQIQENLKKLFEAPPKDSELSQIGPSDLFDQFISNPTILPIVPSASPLDIQLAERALDADIVPVESAEAEIKEGLSVPEVKKEAKEEPKEAAREEMKASRTREMLSFHESKSLELLPKMKAKVVEEETQTDDFEASVMSALDSKINSLISARLEVFKKKITEKIYTNVYGTLSGNILGLVAKHMASIKEVLRSNIQQAISKSIDTTRIQNQINIIHKDLQDNIMFVLQKIFISSFENSCEKMTKEVARVYTEGIAIYKQRLEAEESLFEDQRKRSEEIVKKNMELVDNLQAIANSQLVSLEKVCDAAKHKAEGLLNSAQEKIITPPGSEEVKRKDLSRIETKPAPVEDLKKIINYSEAFKESLAMKNASGSINALTKGKLGENAFLAFLNTFDEEKLSSLQSEPLEHAYIRLMIYRILKYFNDSRTPITPSITTLMRKAQVMLVPSNDNYQDYMVVQGMLMSFLKQTPSGY